jgi:hypothetical protein
MKESGSFVLYHTKKHERNSVCLSLCGPVSRNSCKTENEGYLLVTATESLYLHHTKTQPRNEILVARIAVWRGKCLAKSETNKTNRLEIQTTYVQQSASGLYVYHSKIVTHQRPASQPAAGANFPNHSRGPKQKIRDGWRCKLWLIAANSLTPTILV